VVNLSLPDKMPIEIKKEIELEIAHVLFIDIVGYSKLSINDQHAAVEELTRIVRASEQFQRAEAASRLIRIPTGDGMALAFYTNPEGPPQCAVEISRALKEHPGLQLRMGIHSGPVSGVVDVNERANLTGAGINMAKRVMDCGDAGHILLSKHVAEDLEEYEKWRPLLHDLGTCEAKHGVRVSVVNLSRSARTFALLIAQEHLQIFLRNFAYGVATPVAVFKVSVFNLDAMRLALCRASFFVQ
jgi:class 3 adenylate cyclase